MLVRIILQYNIFNNILSNIFNNILSALQINQCVSIQHLNNNKSWQQNCLGKITSTCRLVSQMGNVNSTRNRSTSPTVVMATLLMTATRKEALFIKLLRLLAQPLLRHFEILQCTLLKSFSIKGNLLESNCPKRFEEMSYIISDMIIPHPAALKSLKIIPFF